MYVANSVKSAFIPSTGFSGVIIICSSVLLVADIGVGCTGITSLGFVFCRWECELV